MGTDDISGDERPIHRVALSPFRLAETPVTNRQYGLFLSKTGHREPDLWRSRRYSDPEQPVVGVSWRDAMRFCEWLTERVGVCFALPCEAQWEYAARGPEGRRFPWGDAEPTRELACFGKNMPDPVGAHPVGKGPYGTLDQAGNVWEWCLDVWDENAYAKRSHEMVVRDPVVAEGDSEWRCLRGGAWLNPAENLRSALRAWGVASIREHIIGFRVAAVPANLGP